MITNDKDLAKELLDANTKYLRKTLNATFKSKLNPITDELANNYNAVIASLQEALTDSNKNDYYVTVKTTRDGSEKETIFKRANIESALKGEATYNIYFNIFTTLLPEISAKFELGHQSASVLTFRLKNEMKKLAVLNSRDPKLKELQKLLSASEQVDKITDGTDLSINQVYKILAEYDRNPPKLNIKTIKSFNYNTDSAFKLTLEWEDKVINQLKGRMGSIIGTLASKIIKGQINSLRDGIKKVNLADYQSSPSFNALVLAKLIKEEEEIFEKLKTVKVIKSKTKVENKHYKSRSKKVNSPSLNLNISTPKKLKSPPGVRKKSFEVRETPESKINLRTLIPRFNALLPPTVKKNMVFPALRNRTGRFAQSTRIVDITQTPKGFPSVAYTYQKFPYQVFEPGRGRLPWADEDRDPRKLIEASIREIAAEIMDQRFYMRRV
jgi:hypothetical protein